MMKNQPPHESPIKELAGSLKNIRTLQRARTSTNTDTDEGHEDVPAILTSSSEDKPKRPKTRLTDRRVLRFYHSIMARLHATSPSCAPLLKKALAISACLLLFSLSKRYIHVASFFKDFLAWMQLNPRLGIAVYVIVYALHLVLLFPGTPFVLGAGYVYKTTYGWTMGIILCSFLSLFGSLLGSICAFLLGRYCIKEWVRSRWSTSAGHYDDETHTNTNTSKKTLYLQALDAAISENGFKIMVMLYLTPITPLGPISYLIGTTNMKLSSFAKAKIAALPLTMMYVFLGASTGTLFLNNPDGSKKLGKFDKLTAPGAENNSGKRIDTIEHSATLEQMEEIPVSTSWIIAGIIFSILSITYISIRVKKEIDQILEKQGKAKEDLDKEAQRLSSPALAMDQGPRLRRH